MIGNVSRNSLTTVKRSGIAFGVLLLALTIAGPFAVQPAPRLALELQDYAALPITADNTDANTRAQLARVNFLREEPGGRRFFVNDLNGPLYILDKQTKTFTKYLDFNGLVGGQGCSRNSRTHGTSRPGSPTSFSIPTTPGTACSIPSTWKTHRHPGLRRHGAASCPGSI